MGASNRYAVSGGNAESVVPLVLDGAGNFQPASAANPVPVQIVGSGGGGGALDLLYTDDTGAQFIYRDDGATPPVFTAYLIPAGTVYVVGTNPRPFYSRNVVTTESVIADDGVNLPLDSLAMDGQVVPPSGTGTQTFTVVYGGHTYIQTLTYVAGAVSSSVWVKQ